MFEFGRAVADLRDEAAHPRVGALADRRAEIERLQLLIRDTGTAPSEAAPSAEDGVAVLPCLRSLIPDGILRRGSVVAVADRVAPWPAKSGTPSYLALALAAGATAGGAWCAAVGLPSFGAAAAAGLGADLGRLLLVDDPGGRWAEAVAVLAGAVDLILVRPPARAGAEDVRRITARLRTTSRQRGAVMIVAGAWGGANLTLRTTQADWRGLGSGAGHLTGRSVTVVAEGRAALGRPQTVRLWLPAADGTAAERRTAEVPIPVPIPVPVPVPIRIRQKTARLRSA